MKPPPIEAAVCDSVLIIRIYILVTLSPNCMSFVQHVVTSSVSLYQLQELICIMDDLRLSTNSVDLVHVHMSRL